MSSRRSDNLDNSAAAAAVLDVPPRALLSYAPPRARGWINTLLSNGPLPLLVLAIIGLGFVVESRGFGGYYQRIVMLVGFNIMLAVSLQLINGFSGQFSLGHAGFMAVGAYLAAYPCLTYSHQLTDPLTPLLFYLALAIIVVAVGFALLALFVLIRKTAKLHSSLPGVLMIAMFGWLVWDIYAASKRPAGEVPGWLAWSKSIELLQSMFNSMLTHGEPRAHRMSAAIPHALQQPLSFLVLVIGGGCCASVVGLIVGLPTLRLRGDYLAIATLGLAEIIRIVIQNSEPLGGALGLTGIPKYTNFAWLYTFVLITIVVIWRVAYSAKGRAIMAVREDEIAAAATGIDTTQQKVMAFVIGAFFGGVAGALFALHERSITPGYFGLVKSIEIVVMVTLGGLGSISGAVLAAIVLTLLPEILRDPPSVWPWGVIVAAVIIAAIFVVRRAQGILNAAVVVCVCIGYELIRLLARWRHIDLSDFRMIIYSLLLIFMMLLRPQGLLGGRELFPRRGVPRRDATPTEDRDDVDTMRVPM